MKDYKHKQLAFTNWCIENKTTIYIFIIMVTVAGLFTYQNLPKESFPEIVVPQMVITTIYPGTSPEDVENLITKPIEKELKTVKGVKKVTSNSVQDFSAVIVEYNTGEEVAEAKQRTQDAVDKARSELPNDLDEEPSVQELDFSEFPVMQVNVSGNYPLKKLKEFAEVMQDEIEALPQVRRADLIGALEREIQINVDLYRMQAAGINFGNIEQAVSSENVNISGGDLNVNDVRRTLRVTGEFKNIKSLENIIIRSSTGNTVFLREIASVEDSYEERQDFARLDGNPVISLSVIKRSGENLIEASDNIQQLVQRMKAETFPEGLNITITGDQSDQTRTDLHDLLNTIILGFIFVVFVLMFFMGTRDAIFVALSVPLSSLLAFLILALIDYFSPGLSLTLNFMVMFAFLLGLGIVVDDAIVVIENTHRIFNNEDIPIKEAAKKAAGEVFIPVLSGTITTIAPFVPLLFWPGLIGEFMKFLPITLIATLFASLVVAYVMNPVFAVSFMKKHDEETSGSARTLLKPLLIMGIIAVISYFFSIGLGNFVVFLMLLYVVNHYVFSPLIYKFQHNLWPRLMYHYRRLISFAISGRRPVYFLMGVFGLLVFTFFVFVTFMPKVEFFPSGEPNFVYVYNQMPIGTDATKTDSITKILEQRVNKVLAPYRGVVTSVISNVGIGAGDPMNPDLTVTPHKSKLTVAFVKFEERLDVSTRKILEEIRASVQGIPGTEISVEQESGGPPVGKPISIEIAGADFDQLLKIQGMVRNAIARAGIQGIEELKSDLVLNKPEIIVDIDREKAAREGISTAQIALEIRTALYGKEVSQYREAKDEYPIMVRLDTSYRNRMENILAMNISYLDMASGRFRQVPLNAVADVQYGTSFSSINRKNQERLVTLSSNVLTGYNANEIVGQVQEVVNELDLPTGYTIKMGGEQEDQQETFLFLVAALVAAASLIFVVLVTQFNSVSKPLIIFTTILFSFIGVLLGFVVFNMTFSILMTGVGIVALAGIVVKNGIILIEFTDELRSRGYDLHTAVVEGGAIRLNPVILTASAAVLGLIPLAIGLNINFVSLFTHLNPEIFIGGQSSVFWGPLAWTIIFGLTFSTFLTLVIVPVMYTLVERVKLRVKKRRENEVLA
ncbi:efflux RND transporter permease subunit [Rhodocytophaga aerolata]|uniref:Efflux RND transporter permease subunit n=1 Tax=Rhodocytophaga aerolata TaxID=455078 RepID=A0ABT8RIZ1_9BACT|nr:efflux RND transporter permease subunit [Rhodocytophaga aerolata]MDO1451148.1 efflux RND transporter permease subunit [Rhodocytophaga aerolata]